MKTIKPLALALAALALALCAAGCAPQEQTLQSTPLVNPDGTVPVGSTLVVHDPGEALTLLDNKDALAASGLYYASWAAGQSRPYQNEDGDTVELYDAQLSLVVKECETPAEAQAAAAEWQQMVQLNYRVRQQSQLQAAGQQYDVYLFDYQSAGNPYAAGAAAIALRGNAAIEIELACQAGYQGDALAVLTTFLQGCQYPG